jgi:hypothetical protein
VSGSIEAAARASDWAAVIGLQAAFRREVARLKAHLAKTTD